MNRTISLFIAMSLDGYVADQQGNVDWLQGMEPDQNDMLSYEEFSKNIDTVIMGWNTYHQITTELSPQEWMYEDFMSYVLTHRERTSTAKIHFVKEDVCDLVNRLKLIEGKGIWICGGPGVIQPLLRNDLIDVIHISIIPIILGKGIRLFEESEKQVKLELKETRSYNGIIDVIYERRT